MNSSIVHRSAAISRSSQLSRDPQVSDPPRAADGHTGFGVPQLLTVANSETLAPHAPRNGLSFTFEEPNPATPGFAVAAISFSASRMSRPTAVPGPMPLAATSLPSSSRWNMMNAPSPRSRRTFWSLSLQVLRPGASGHIGRTMTMAHRRKLRLHRACSRRRAP